MEHCDNNTIQNTNGQSPDSISQCSCPGLAVLFKGDKMRRSSQKQIKLLLKEVRDGIGAKNEHEVWEHIAKVKAFFEKHLSVFGCSAIQLSPYIDNSWTLSMLLPGEGCRWGCLWTSYEEWQDTPMALVQKARERGQF